MTPMVLSMKDCLIGKTRLDYCSGLDCLDYISTITCLVN